jgi:hypothetical protein
MSVTHILFLSPKASTNPEDGHYYTVYRAWLEAGKLAGLTPLVWSAKVNENGLGTQAVTYGPNGEWLIDMEVALNSIEAIPRENIIAVAYEGCVEALSAVDTLTRLGIPTLVNFLSSHELVQLKLLKSLGGSIALQGICDSTSEIVARGGVITADTRLASRLLQQVGIPSLESFPIFSSIEARQDFSTSEFDLGLLNPTNWQIVKFASFAVVARLSGRRIRLKMLSQAPVPKVLQRVLASLRVKVLIGKFSGNEYLESLDCKRWILDSRRVHHFLGSSGQYLDLIANNAQVFSFKYSAMSATAIGLTPESWSSTTPTLNAFASTTARTAPIQLKALTPMGSLREILSLFAGREAGEKPKSRETSFAESLVRIAHLRSSKKFRWALRFWYRLPRWFLIRLIDRT